MKKFISCISIILLVAGCNGKTNISSTNSDEQQETKWKKMDGDCRVKEVNGQWKAVCFRKGQKTKIYYLD